MQTDNLANTKENDQRPLILLTGATGYIGGRLLKQLEQAGQRLRCLARNPASIQASVGAQTEVVAGDLLDITSLTATLAGVHTAYYLVHSLGTAGDFEDEDRQAAQNFATAAREAAPPRPRSSAIRWPN